MAESAASAATASVATKKGNNNWRDPIIRLVTLQTISAMDLWKDVAHGKKTEFYQTVLEAWEDNLPEGRQDRFLSRCSLVHGG